MRSYGNPTPPFSSILLLRLLSTNLGVRLPLTSTFPWLVVMSPCVAPHLHLLLPLVLTARHLLLSSCRATSTSHHLEAFPAFKMPLPHVRWRLLLIVAMPLVKPPSPLVLSTLHCLLSADASPPVCLLFASWLLRPPCCRAAAASCPLEALPPPCNKPHTPQPLVHQLVAALPLLLHRRRLRLTTLP